MTSEYSPEDLAQIGRKNRQDEGLAESTRRDLASAGNVYLRFCEQNGYEPVPASAQTVAEYLASERSRLSMQSIRRAARAIDYLHEQAGHSSPTESDFVQEVLDGIRVLGGLMEEAPRNVRMSEQLQPSLEKMIRHMPDTLLGHRDRALLLIAAAGSLSRPEVVNLLVDDVKYEGNETTIYVTGPKERTLVVVADIGLNPGSAVQSWLAASGVYEGYLFRVVGRVGEVSESPLTPQALTTILRQAADRAKLPDSAASTKLFNYQAEKVE